MPCWTKDTYFTLNADVPFAAKGALGKLTRIDDYHIELVFGPLLEDSYVLDIYDTELEILSAIEFIANPSMTDPPQVISLCSRRNMKCNLNSHTLQEEQNNGTKSEYRRISP
jgi:hypothetical protein